MGSLCPGKTKSPPNSSSAAGGGLAAAGDKSDDHTKTTGKMMTASNGGTDGGPVDVPPSNSGDPSLISGPAQPLTAPHMFMEIIANEKTTAAAAVGEDQIYTGILLAGKTKKYWVDSKTRANCFMLFPKALSITWSEDPKYWNWHPLKEASQTSNTEIEMASLKEVCWLDIQGKQELSHLTPGVNYEVIFEVMLNESAKGWTVPVNLGLKLPNGTIQHRKERLQEKPKAQWLKLKVGEVKAQQGQKGEMETSMSEHGNHWKSGLVIKGIEIIPKA